MNKKFFVSAVLLACGGAFAGDDVPGNCGQGSGKGRACLEGGGTTTINNKPSANAGAISASRANAVSVSRGGRATATGGNAVSNAAGGNAVSNAAGGAGGAGGDGSSSVIIYGDQHKRSAAAAYAAPLYPTANCAVGNSAGMGVPGFTFSGAVTQIEENCARIEKSKRMEELGDHEVAREIMCNDPEIRAARARVGDPCLPKVVNTAIGYDESDPFIRRRLNLD